MNKSAHNCQALSLAALLVVRALPALLNRPTIGNQATVVAGLLQATSLPFIVAASMIGIELGLVDPGTAAALIAAGLLSVLIFPLAALTIARRGEAMPARQSTEPMPPIGAGRATLERSVT